MLYGDRHITIHTGENPFKCNYCGMVKYGGWHITIHTGEKPFNCNNCGMVKYGGLLISMHTGEKPFKCNKCGMAIHMREKPIKFNIKNIMSAYILTHGIVQKSICIQFSH